MNERDKRIIELYNQGIKYDDIADEVGLASQTISIKVMEFKRKGLIGDRRHEAFMAKLDKIAELYNQGWTCEAIGKEINYSSDNVVKNVRKMIKDGRLKKRKKPRTITEINVKRKAAEKTTHNENAVCCCQEISSHCIYGSRHMEMLCNYITLTGKRRGCSYLECTKYEEGTPIDARRSISLED
jgi:hypothetical protein